MKKNLLIALIAAAAIAPIAAQAQSYVGANIGRTDQKATIDGDTLKDHPTAFKLYAGYAFNENFGLEAGFADLGKGTVNHGSDILSTRPRSLYLAATGNMPLAERFALTGKIGVAKTRSKFTSNGIDGDTLNKTSLMFGVGTAYAITPTVLGVVEFENFGKVIDEDGNSMKANVLSVGVRFKF